MLTLQYISVAEYRVSHAVVPLYTMQWGKIYSEGALVFSISIRVTQTQCGSKFDSQNSKLLFDLKFTLLLTIVLLTIQHQKFLVFNISFWLSFLCEIQNMFPYFPDWDFKKLFFSASEALLCLDLQKIMKSHLSIKDHLILN